MRLAAAAAFLLLAAAAPARDKREIRVILPHPGHEAAKLLGLYMREGPFETDLFVGHYGYVIRYPAGFAADSFFMDRVVERLELHSPCRVKKGCGDDGISMSVMPIWKMNGLGYKTLEEYVAGQVSYYRKEGSDPTEPARRKARMPGWTIRKQHGFDPLDAVTFLQGQKVIYAVEHRAGRAADEAMIDAIAEIQPHAKPPGP